MLMLKMNEQPPAPQPQEFSVLMKKSFQGHWRTLRCIFPVLIAIVIVKDAYLYVGDWPTNLAISLPLGIVMAILMIYGFSFCLLLGQQSLLGQPCDLKQNFSRFNQHVLKVFYVCLTIVITMIVLYYVARGVATLMIYRAVPPKAAYILAYFTFISIPFFIGIVCLWFALPLVILEKSGVMAAFSDSFKLVWWKNWLRAFAAYALVVVVYLITSPATLHGHILHRMHLNAPFDLLVFCLFVPLIVNLTVLLLQDLRARQSH